MWEWYIEVVEIKRRQYPYPLAKHYLCVGIWTRTELPWLVVLVRTDVFLTGASSRALEETSLLLFMWPYEDGIVL